MSILVWFLCVVITDWLLFFLCAAVYLLLDMRKNPARLKAYWQEYERIIQPMMSYLEIHGKWSDEVFKRWVQERKDIEGWDAD